MSITVLIGVSKISSSYSKVVDSLLKFDWPWTDHQSTSVLLLFPNAYPTRSARLTTTSSKSQESEQAGVEAYLNAQTRHFLDQGYFSQVLRQRHNREFLIGDPNPKAYLSSALNRPQKNEKRKVIRFGPEQIANKHIQRLIEVQKELQTLDEDKHFPDRKKLFLKQFLLFGTIRKFKYRPLLYRIRAFFMDHQEKYPKLYKLSIAQREHGNRLKGIKRQNKWIAMGIFLIVVLLVRWLWIGVFS